MKEVSLYIPCFNAEATIQFCLEAVFRQTYPLREVVVIDDGSSDDTIKIASRYPVRLITHGDNLGLAVSRNTAIRNINNVEFVASLDADCRPEPDWLEHLMDRFNLPIIAGVGGKLREHNPSTVFDIWRSVHMKQYWKDEETHPAFLFGSNTVFRKDALINIGLYNQNLKNNYEDVDISERLKEKGGVLIYEPKALVNHLKKDDISSMLNTFWRWNLTYYQKNGYYSNQESLLSKLKDNIGLANRYLEDDLASQRYQLIYLNFLLALYLCLRDFEYFTFQSKWEDVHADNYSVLSFWLGLLDFTFFYHLDYREEKLSSLVPEIEKNVFLQNVITLNLIIGRPVREKFDSRNFLKILYKHLLLSVYNINDMHLVDRLLNMSELHQDWSSIFEKKTSRLNIVFLENIFLDFKKWLDGLMFSHPGMNEMLEVSAENTDRPIFLLKRRI